MVGVSIFNGIMANLKIGTFNVKGLRDAKKRRKIFHFIHQKSFDIILLQETQSIAADERIWKNEFGGTLMFAHGANDSRGVLIAIKRKCPIQIISVKGDREGRCVMCVFKHEKEVINLVNIYAPNKDDPVFLAELL